MIKKVRVAVFASLTFLCTYKLYWEALMLTKKTHLIFFFVFLSTQTNGMNQLALDEKSREKCLLVAKYLLHYPKGQNVEEAVRITDFFKYSYLSGSISKYIFIQGMAHLPPELGNEIYHDYIYLDAQKHFVACEAQHILQSIQQRMIERFPYFAAEVTVKEKLLCQDIEGCLYEKKPLGDLGKYYNGHEFITVAKWQKLCDLIPGFHERLATKKDTFEKLMSELITFSTKDILNHVTDFEIILAACKDCNTHIHRDATGIRERLLLSKQRFILPLESILSDVARIRFIRTLIESNKGNNELIVFTSETLEQWNNLDLSTRAGLADLRIDIESQPETITDKMIRHFPLLASAIAPDIIWYHLDHIKDFARISSFIINPMCFLIGILFAGTMGDTVFPFLDGNFHSHVKVLKKFFGDNVRLDIKRRDSFAFFSFLQSILAYTSNSLIYTETITGCIVGAVLCIMRCMLYECMNTHLTYLKPIDRKAPDAWSRDYRLEHLITKS
jgi:hypothetical protein